MSWQIQSVVTDSAELTALLEAGWEPFAVTRDGTVWRVWLRRGEWTIAFMKWGVNLTLETLYEYVRKTGVRMTKMIPGLSPILQRKNETKMRQKNGGVGMVHILMTREGKRAVINKATDLVLYEAPANTAILGTNLYCHVTRSGRLFYYAWHWSTLAEDEYKMVTEAWAKNFVLERLSKGGIGVRDAVCKDLWGEPFFCEDV